MDGKFHIHGKPGAINAEARMSCFITNNT